MSKIYLDENGYQEYLKKIDELREKIRKNSLDMSEYQSDDAYGDGWHDNFAYEQAMQKDNSLHHELDNKLKRLKDIVIVKSTNNSNIVDINTIVELKFDEEEIEKYIISGGYESNIDDDIPTITINSELGKAIYKKKLYENFSYKIGENIVTGKIVSINNLKK